MISGKIAIIEGDITKQPVEAIVNAANSSLMMGIPALSASRVGRISTVQVPMDFPRNVLQKLLLLKSRSFWKTILQSSK